MPRPVSSIPQVRLHKPSGQARVRHDGREYYLGPYGSQEASRRYSELLLKLSGGVAKPEVAKFTKSVNEIALLFLDFAATYYVKNGRQTDEVFCIRSAIRALMNLFGEIPASDFGPLALKAVRQAMVENGLSRIYVNKSVGRIRRAFRWACENELVSPTVLHGLQSVSPLLAGRTTAKDYAPRRPVPQDQIDSVKQVVPNRTADLIELQLLTGARSGEILSLTPSMIDRSEAVWLARLKDHKTSHHGKERVLVFGPQAQLILRKYLSVHPSARMFKIRRSWYGHSVRAACEGLGIKPAWTPHWLRHTAATRLREQYGLEAAQIMLGHSRADMTQLYAALNLAKAVEVALEAG
ncbi:MAG: site-specific tyrosine recombinase XerC [Schlesneria sp.]|nr:site-specific tyrosine recombinase XerC [Schlesneria sp.]